MRINLVTPTSPVINLDLFTIAPVKGSTVLFRNYFLSLKKDKKRLKETEGENSTRGRSGG